MRSRGFYWILGWASELSATISGLVLFAVGLTGLYGHTLSNTSIVIVLLEPLGYGEMWDDVYWFSIMITGILLTTQFWTRLSATLAMFMIGFKVALVRF